MWVFFIKLENFRENKFQRKLVFTWSRKKASLSKGQLISELGQESIKNLLGFLGDLKTPKSHSEKTDL